MTAWARLVLFGAVVASLAGVALTGGLPHSPAELRGLADRWGPLAPAGFALAWALLTPAMVSGTLLATAAGLLFGVWGGFGIGLAGATAGGIAAFGIARLMGGRAVQDLAGERVERINARIEGRAFLVVLGARIAPGVPATVLNYACGLSRIRLPDFVAGIALGGAPRIFAYTAIGGSGGDFGSPAAVAGLGLLAMLTLGPGAALVLRRLRLRTA